MSETTSKMTAEELVVRIIQAYDWGAGKDKAIEIITVYTAPLTAEVEIRIEAAYRKGYDNGFEDGCSDTPATADQMAKAIAAVQENR